MRGDIDGSAKRTMKRLTLVNEREVDEELQVERGKRKGVDHQKLQEQHAERFDRRQIIYRLIS